MHDEWGVLIHGQDRSFNYIACIYNSQKFIRETINSVLSQSFKLYELLIINDASTDDTEKIIQSYNDPRIVYKKFSRNRGVANARNYGIIWLRVNLLHLLIVMTSGIAISYNNNCKKCR
ncbi:glycosyltransferase family 2 protein [Limosilactobacillus fermentum]|uniref:glycosyltransferase family 2 protein n=1 Tax=Limosilactobacillus fermentum TaxID=1613 RepID=UPI0035A1A94D